MEKYAEAPVLKDTMPKFKEGCSDSKSQAGVRSTESTATVLNLVSSQVQTQSSVPASAKEGADLAEQLLPKTLPLCPNSTTNASLANISGSMENSSPMLIKPRGRPPPFTEEEMAQKELLLVPSPSPSPAPSEQGGYSESHGIDYGKAKVVAERKRSLIIPDFKQPQTTWMNKTITEDHGIKVATLEAQRKNVPLLLPEPDEPVPVVFPNNDCIPEIDEDCDGNSRTILNAGVEA